MEKPLHFRSRKEHPIRFSVRIILLLAAALFIGCAQTPEPSESSASIGTRSYNDLFDPWRASNRALEPASHGDKDAQDVFFLAAYVRVSQSFLGGEDLEQMNDNCRRLLAALGDEAFSTALRRLRPEVRCAVMEFLDMKTVVHTYPKTYRLLQSAPKIKWPFDRANRNG
jgi:hypothetical protein